MKFTSTREFTYQREYSAPYESVLAILQDPYRLCAHSPNFYSMAPDDDSEGSDSTPLSGASTAGDGMPQAEHEGEVTTKGRLSKTQWNIITDKIPVVGPLKATIKVRAKIVPVEDGVDTEVEAGLGTKVKSKYRVERKTEGGSERCVLKEDTVVEALTIMMPYVYSTLKDGHMHSFESIGKEVENDAP